MATVSLARNAMATRFELVLNGDDPARLRAAGEEALLEIERLEDQLSLFRPASEIAHLNARAARESVQVTPVLFSLLEHAQKLSRETEGAFDITIAPLVRCWGFLTGGGRHPSHEEVSQAREAVGMQHVLLNRGDFTVRFGRPGVMLDLGAIGKGFAIDQAISLLREAGVTSALLHGGTSTVYALGSPPGNERWTIGLPLPRSRPTGRPLSGSVASMSGERPLFTYTQAAESSEHTIKIDLQNEALSVSAIWGRFFEEEDETLGHIIDPRTGYPANVASLAVVALPSATESDALSTALLTFGLDGHARFAGIRPEARTLVAGGLGTGFRALSRGISLEEFAA